MLALFLIFIPLQLWGTVSTLIQGHLPIRETKWLILNAVILCFWGYLSYRLREINKKRQLKEFSDFLESLHRMKGALTLEELESIWHHAQGNWPQHKKISFNAYTLKKLDLTQGV